MKKKVLASLLAVCMMAGLAVPAFAYTGAGYDSSSVAGLDEEITALAFAKDSYTIAADADPLNLAEELTAYCGDKKIIQEPTLEWNITDSLAFGISDTGEVSNIGEKTGSATVTVKTPDGKISATTKVVASAGKSTATSFKFKETSYKTTDGANTIEVKVIPSSDNAKFTDDQITTISGWTNKFTATGKDKKVNKLTGITVSEAKEGGIVFVIPVTQMVNGAKDNVGDYTLKLNSAALPKADSTAKPYTAVDRSTKVAKQDGKPAKKVIRKQNVEIEVGQIVDLNDYVAYTSGANYNDGVTWSIEPYTDDAAASDYAVQNGTDLNKILGVAEGKVKAVATMTNDAKATIGDNNDTTTVIVTVKARGTLAKPDAAAKYAITPATASPKAGDKVALTLNDADGKAVENVTWSVSNGALATITTAANPTTLNAKAAGKVVVYARVADKVVATAEITIVGNGTTTTPSVPGTSNPSTGDSIFSNLF